MAKETVLPASGWLQTMPQNGPRRPVSTLSGRTAQFAKGPLGANSGHCWTTRRTGQTDPKRLFRIGPMNERKALESDFCGTPELCGMQRQRAVVPEKLAAQH